MKRAAIISISISFILLCGYILPHWFILKESAEVRSKFAIGYVVFEGVVTLKDAEGVETSCNGQFTIKRADNTFEAKIICDDSISSFKYKDVKLISQTIKSKGNLFVRPISHLIEYSDLIIPLPISSEKLKGRVCNIVKECDSVEYKRLGGVINYRFISRQSGNYYMLEKEALLPSALFIKEKNLEIEARKYYSFSTNIRFPSVIEVRVDKQTLTILVDDLTIE